MYQPRALPYHSIWYYSPPCPYSLISPHNLFIIPSILPTMLPQPHHKLPIPNPSCPLPMPIIMSIPVHSPYGQTPMLQTNSSILAPTATVCHPPSPPCTPIPIPLLPLMARLSGMVGGQGCRARCQHMLHFICVCKYWNACIVYTFAQILKLYTSTSNRYTWPRNTYYTNQVR